MTRYLSYPDGAAEVAEHIATHDVHGYSQNNRAGDGTVETITLSDDTKVRLHGGDYDCSEDVRMCYAAMGVLEWDYWTSYMWTGNEYDRLTSHGFVRLPFDWHEVQRGDILFVSGHTGIALGGGKQADARGDEVGGITGPRQGDQTGHEIEIRDLQWYWTYIYRYVGPPRPSPEPKPEQRPGAAKNDLGLKYESHCQTVGWLKQVHDGQTSGTEGFAKRLEALRIAFPKDVVADVIAHVQGIGSVYYEGVTADAVIGTTGEQRRLEAIRIRVTKRPKSLKNKRLRIQGHVQGVGWTDVVGEDEWCGTIGESRRLEALRMWFE